MLNVKSLYCVYKETKNILNNMTHDKELIHTKAVLLRFR